MSNFYHMNLYHLQTDVPNKPIVVVENHFLRLHCAASGQPKPDIVWSRLDGRPMTDGAWQGKNSTLSSNLISNK